MVSRTIQTSPMKLCIAIVSLEVAVGPNRWINRNIISLEIAFGANLWINRNMKQIITTVCTKTAIFQLIWHPDISKFVERELMQ